MQLHFSKYDFKIKQVENTYLIFDAFRKLWVVLTPEEWVRQNMLVYLTNTMQYPAALIAVEKSILLGSLLKRCDIIVYKADKPWMIVECKAQNIPLSTAVLDQILMYNQVLKVEYLIVSNGSYTNGWHIENNVVAITEMPNYLV